MVVVVGYVWFVLIALFIWQIWESAVNTGVQVKLREIDRKLYEQSRDVSRIDSVDPKIYEDE